MIVIFKSSCDMIKELKEIKEFQQVQPTSNKVTGLQLSQIVIGRIQHKIKVYLMLRKFLSAAIITSALAAQQEKVDCCGIVGMVMKEPISKQQQLKMEQAKAKIRYSLQEFLCQGVELLKNRGYDSAGVFTLSAREGNQSRLVKYAQHGLKQAGCINKVIDQVMSQTGFATSGIAHTRWATCGEKIDCNSHPHFDEQRKIFLVHNGIITNHAQLKNRYLSHVKFTSQTDTEVIVQYLALKRKEGMTMLQALNQFTGIAEKKSQWGLVIIDTRNKETIYTATKGSPLLIGFSRQEDEIMIVSERIAFQKHANCYFPSYDGEIYELKVSQIPLLKQKMKDRLIFIDKPQPVELEPPKQFSHWYQYQICQQSKIPFKPAFERVQALQFGQYQTMIACGSSYYAALASEYSFKKLRCFKKMHIIDPVQLQVSDITENQTVVLISQSGETKDLINIVEECKRYNSVKTIGIINVEGSTLARKVDFPIYINVGRQVCVAATKSFFHQVLNLIQFSTQVAAQKKSASLEDIMTIRKSLLEVPSKVEEILAVNRQKCKQLALLIHKKQSLYLLGKRQSMAIAKQAALKIKQLNYIHAQAMGACEMKHGPIALIQSNKDKQTVVFLFILKNETFTVMMNALDQMHSRKAYVVVITDCLDLIEQQHNETVEKIKKENQKLQEQKKKKIPQRIYDFALTVPHLEHLSHLLTIIPIQLLVSFISELNDIDPDHPRNLAKSVTV